MSRIFLSNEMNIKIALSVFISCILLLRSVFLFAGEFKPLQGHIKAQYQYAQVSDDSLSTFLSPGQGENHFNETLFDFRLIVDYSGNNWQLLTHYQLNGVTGSGVEIRNQVGSQFPALSNNNDNQWLDLRSTIRSDQDSLVQHSLDRFFMAYTSDRLAIKLGRQALTWGNGLVFRPLDLFNPFSPYELDTSYKPGTDMFYAQWLQDSGSDISLLVVPRRGLASGTLDSSQSSVAAKWHYFGTEIQADFLLARDYDDIVLAVGFSGALGEAVWRTDIVPVFLDAGGSRISLVANLEYAWQWSGQNVTAYMEYYRNGYGMTGKAYTLADLPLELTDKRARSQLFNTGRDYLATGARLELTALLQLMPTLMLNTNDQSMLLFVSGLFSLSQNLRADFGLVVGAGSKGTEFGGIETYSDSHIYLQVPDQLYGRVTYYF